MPKLRSMIRINKPEFLKVIRHKGHSISSCSQLLGITRQGLNQQIINSEIAPKKLSELAKLIEISAEEMGLICSKVEASPSEKLERIRTLMMSILEVIDE